LCKVSFLSPEPKPKTNIIYEPLRWYLNFNELEIIADLGLTLPLCLAPARISSQYSLYHLTLCKSKKEKYECCGQTFKTKEELEAHKEKHHKNPAVNSNLNLLPAS